MFVDLYMNINKYSILFFLIFCAFSLSETILISEDNHIIKERIKTFINVETVIIPNDEYVLNNNMNELVPESSSSSDYLKKLNNNLYRDECSNSFTIYGSDDLDGDGINDPCHLDDGSGYFAFSWTGGCTAMTVEYSGGELDLSSYGFTEGFRFNGFESGATETFLVTFDSGSIGVGEATNDCPTCSDSFSIYGSGDLDGDGNNNICYDDDGSGYFTFTWTGGCTAMTIEYSGGEIDLSSYAFTESFTFSGFDPGSSENFVMTFDNGSIVTGEETNDCPFCVDSGCGNYAFEIITEADGLRNGPDYDNGIIYYPIDAEGPLPGIVLIPGYMCDIDYIDSWGPYLASHGIVAMFCEINWAFNPFSSPESRKTSLLDALVTMREENERIDSPLFNNIYTDKIAVGGYSMGGGGAQLAAQEDLDVGAVIALSAYLNNSDDAFNNIKPILFMSSELDDVAASDEHTNPFYFNTPDSTDKLLFEMIGGSHTTVISPYNNPDLGPKVIYFIEKYIDDNLENCNLLIEAPILNSQFLTNIECQELGDINGDGIVNVLDIVQIVNLVLTNEYEGNGDLNGDGIVNVLDIVQLVNIILN